MSMGRRDLDYDEVLRYIGQFGTFQVFLVEHSKLKKKILTEKDLLLALARICRRWIGCDGLCFHRFILCRYVFFALELHILLFTGLEPRYRCRVPECELSNSSTYTQEGREGLLPSW